jgi:hypothetical protein
MSMCKITAACVILQACLQGQTQNQKNADGAGQQCIMNTTTRCPGGLRYRQIAVAHSNIATFSQVLCHFPPHYWTRQLVQFNSDLSNLPSASMVTTPTTSAIESSIELEEMTPASFDTDGAAPSPRSTTSASTSPNKRPNRILTEFPESLLPGDTYVASLNDELTVEDTAKQQPNGNKRRRDRRRHRCTAKSVECHPFFNAEYLNYIEDQVQRLDDKENPPMDQENPPMDPPALTNEKIFNDAFASNGRRHARRARRQNRNNRAATGA